MTRPLRVGTAEGRPGELAYGTFEAVPLPTGGADSFPVLIAQGRGGTRPVLWLTANIHGGEYDGLAVIHRLITRELVAHLTGTIVAIPTLSPAGLRTAQRSPYYLHGRDPNRLFPGLDGDDAADSPPLALEGAYARLFEHIQRADYLVDLHDYGIRAIPFAFRDPVFYRDGRDKTRAQKLQDAVGAMLEALGLTVVNEYGSAQYLTSNLHRSVSGAALNRARIPAVTIEIGGQQAVNELHVEAVTAGLRNVMRWAGMLPGAPEPLPPVPVVRPGYPVRRTTQPRIPAACIVHHLVCPGQALRAGDPLARMVDIYGRPVGADDGLLRAEQDGFVLGIFAGMAYYPGEAALGMAIRDTNSLVLPMPEGA